MASTVTAWAQSGSAGSVNFVMGTSAAYDQYTLSPASSIVSWMNQKFWRMETFSPYFDSRLGWYSNAWAYNDLYGVATNDALAGQHPDWVLKDQNGNWLYIPFDCWGGHCSQWAFDPGNPDYRNWWIQKVQTQMAFGYKGLWVDDVNMDWRVSDASANTVIPVDPRTGQQMTYDAWQKYIVGFVQQIRSAFPDKEIIHNLIWFAGGYNRESNQTIIDEIKAADFVNLERGIDDPGLTGDDGLWSVNRFLTFIDDVHALGRHVVLDQYGFNGDYQVAGYFLISNGGDGLDNRSVTPFNWWSGYDVKLGDAVNTRYKWNGLWRRDFKNGMVLLNLPGAPQVTVSLPATYQRTDGSSVNSVTLNGGQGAVLTGTSISASSAASLADGTYTILSTWSSKVLDDRAFSPKAGEQVIQWSKNGGSNQSWVFTLKSDGYYTIENASSGMFLTSATWSGGPLQQQPASNNDLQLWSLKPHGSGYVIFNKGSGLVIDDPQGDRTQGTGMVTYSPNYGGNQIWTVQ